MALRRPRINVELDAHTRVKLEWVAGRGGQSPHGFVKALIDEALRRKEEPPPGFGVKPREEAA
ncbi:MAG TPA: hypothetical protein VGH74_15545 [Planctomycetaceae bacterium]|jgi:hypothetical protein